MRSQCEVTFEYRAVTFFGPPFHAVLLAIHKLLRRTMEVIRCALRYPHEATASTRTFRPRSRLASELGAIGRFMSLGSSPFVRHYSGNSLTRLNLSFAKSRGREAPLRDKRPLRLRSQVFFSFPLLTEMFHFSRYPPFQLSLGGTTSSTQ